MMTSLMGWLICLCECSDHWSLKNEPWVWDNVSNLISGEVTQGNSFLRFRVRGTVLKSCAQYSTALLIIKPIERTQNPKIHQLLL